MQATENTILQELWNAASHGLPEAVVFYRIPHAKDFKLLIQHNEPEVFTSLEDIPADGGSYLIVPFTVTPSCPVVRVCPDKMERYPLPLPQWDGRQPYVADESAERERYHTSFSQAHGRLVRNELSKVVLSRRLHLTFTPAPQAAEKTDEQTALSSLFATALAYFYKACHYRPNSYVAFWWTRQTEAWLTATPEPLLERRNHCWGTVALAGTLPWTGRNIPVDEWNEKNRGEQAIVARFIREQLRDVATGVKESETYSLHTGNLQHLCTDFSFSLDSPGRIGEVLQRLHPTPAVCGFPRDAARSAILTDESEPRHYYAGFSGPLGLEGETHLYVSLRCMSFSASGACLYAGGGLMPESEEAEEWEETQRKLMTMLQLI